MGAQRPHDAQHMLVPAAVTGAIVIIVAGGGREQGRDDDGGGVRVAVGAQRPSGDLDDVGHRLLGRAEQH